LACPDLTTSDAGPIGTPGPAWNRLPTGTPPPCGLDRAAAEAARPAQGKIEAERVRLDAAADASRDPEQTLRSERAGLSAGRDLT